MDSAWSVESSGSEAWTTGAAPLIGHKLMARVSSADHLSGAGALLRYLMTAAATADLRLADGESLRYGLVTVQLGLRDGALLVHDANGSGADDLLVDDAVEGFEIQQLTCDEAGSEFMLPPADALGVVTLGFSDGEPFEMVRYLPAPDMSGWWFLTDSYNGDISEVEGHHLDHITGWRSEVLPYLALRPGSVVTVRAGSENVSFDEMLLEGRESDNVHSSG